MIRQTFEKHPEVVALAHGGDYTGKAVWSQLYWWLKDHTEMTTTRDNRLLPIIPVRGNHDHDVGFEEMFWWPERANNYYYTTRLNANSSLITLNTEISRGGDQRNWLEAELAELRPKMRWLLVQYHRPAYPSVRSFDSAAPQREAWVPLFEKFQIDASYESHEHALKRTYPIYEGEIDATRGIIYFGDGGGGVPQRKPDADRWYLEKVGRHDYLHLLTFTDDKLDIVAIDDAGEVIDEFALTQDRRKAVNLEPAEAAP